MKTKLFLMLILSTFFTFDVVSQDYIKKKTGDEIEVKVKEMTSDSVYYTNFEDMKSQVFVIPVSEIFYVWFEDGTKKTFAVEEVNVEPEILYPILKKKRKYYQDGFLLTSIELEEILRNNPNSSKNYSKHESNRVAGQTLLYTGLICVLAGQFVGFYLVIVGGCFEIISIPFLISSNSHLKKSIKKYNLYVQNNSSVNESKK